MHSRSKYTPHTQSSWKPSGSTNPFVGLTLEKAETTLAHVKKAPSSSKEIPQSMELDNKLIVLVENMATKRKIPEHAKVDHLVNEILLNTSRTMDWAWRIFFLGGYSIYRENWVSMRS